MLAADEAADKDPKKASEKMTAKLQKNNSLKAEEFRIGHTKVTQLRRHLE